jgi:hypothetical protein
LRFLKNPEISDYTDYEMITQIRNALKNNEKSVESFFKICVIRERKLVFQSSLFEDFRFGRNGLNIRNAVKQ